jgi:hypothetical protein
VTTLAGNAAANGSANGVGSNALFYLPGGMAVDSAGTVLLTTTDNLVGLCSHHHHLVHDKGWTLSGDPNYRLTFTDPLTREWHSDPPPRE